MSQVFDDPAVTLIWLFKNSFCWKCKFVEDCKRKNKKKDIDDPYCFDDSKMHHMFARQYGDMRSIPEAVEELPEWDNADE